MSTVCFACADEHDKEIRDLQKSFLEYGEHQHGCRWDDKRYGCDCGWEAIRLALQEAINDR